jgi:hypothetical protein
MDPFDEQTLAIVANGIVGGVFAAIFVYSYIRG